MPHLFNKRENIFDGLTLRSLAYISSNKTYFDKDVEVLKRLGFGLFPFLVLAACSSGQQHVDAPVTQANDGSVIYLQKGAREPAQAPTVVWNPAVVSVTFLKTSSGKINS